MRTIVSTPDAPRSIGPFSQAVKANGFIFVSGQVALDPATQTVIDGDVSAQTERILMNIKAILAAAGSGLEHVVRSGVYLRNMGDFAAMNAVYATRSPGFTVVTSLPTLRTIPAASCPTVNGTCAG